jgi:hypothetical protein
MNDSLIVVVPILLVLLVIRSARVRSQEKQQLLNEQAQGILGSGFGGLREPQEFFRTPAPAGVFFLEERDAA